MKYCKQCNAILKDDVVFCASCGTPVGKENARCKACGSILPEGATNCLNCNEKVGGFTPPAIFTPPSNTDGNFNSNSTFNGTQNFNQQSSGEVGDKSKIAAGLLAILLGSLGIYSFYLGNTSKGILQLALSVLSCGLFSPIVSIWGIIDGIIILTDNDYRDAQGKKLI